MSNQANGLYEFGPYRLDTAQRLLLMAGKSVTLAPKTFDLLVLLIEGQGRVLTKGELMNFLWPDTFVEDASLSYQIAALRKAFGEEGDVWIETVPKHGYRFAAPVVKVQEQIALVQQPVPNPPLQLGPWLISTVTALLAAIFALLYFRANQEPAPGGRSMRFLVSPPENIVLGRAVPAISPNGERLAFGGTGPDGKTRLWIRALDSLTAEPVPGSEDVTAVFWSPDSRSVGFFAGERLKRSDLNGGPPQILCNASSGRRPVGTWSRDGVILFNSEDRRGLYVVPATGGEPRPLTSLDASRQENLHAWPQFLSDGRHFIYLVHSAKPENSGIYVSSLDYKGSKQLVNVSTNPSYAELPSGTGYLLFMQGTTLMAQPFDTLRLKLRGERFPVAQQVRLPPADVAGFAAVSVSRNGVLAYQTLQATMELVWFDRQGHRIGTVGEPSNYSNPALSPDGKRLAVARLDDRLGTRDIWLYDLAKAMPSRFTFDPSDESNPMWSPGSDQLAFDFYTKGKIDIYEKATTGIDQAEPLTESSEVKVIESWVPDGRFIFYGSAGKLWMLPLSGDRKPTVLLPESGEPKPAMSWNMKWLAYQSSESGRFEVYVQNFPPSGAAKWQVTTAGGEEPYWSRDGKELFYIEGNRLMVIDVSTDSQTFHFGIPKPLFELRLEVEDRRSRYQVAANGQRFLVNVPMKSTLSAPITVVTNWAAGLK